MKKTLVTVVALLTLSVMALPAFADQEAEGQLQTPKADEAEGAVQEPALENECKEALALPEYNEPNDLSCSAIVGCPEGGSVSCTGWSVCKSKYPNCPVQAGYVECDGRRTYCDRDQCFDCNPLQCHFDCGGGECINGECVCW